MSDVEIKDFTTKGEIQTLIEDYKAEFKKKAANSDDEFFPANKRVSDIVELENGQIKYQYVDLVMEGGGVLGFALVGFTYFLEAVGIRFLRVGGTSAGSINAMLLAAIDYKNGQTKSEQVLEYLSQIDVMTFVDGDDDVKEFINDALKKESEQGFVQKNAAVLTWMWNLWNISDTLIPRLGLNPGEEFRRWLADILARENVKTTKDLLVKMQPSENLVDYRNNQQKAQFTDAPEEMLKIVAADITTETKAVFPLMAKLYWKKPEEVEPADFVRASMSIPIFFYPFHVTSLPQKNKEGKPIRADWIECAKYKGDTPKECFFVDGGVISNFPINLFHNPKRTPRMPTFGARLSANRNINQVDNPLGLLNTVFAAARHSLDFDFLSQNPDYEKVVTRIDTKDHNWLNFALSNEEKFDLFRLGAEAAYEFLRNFRWEDYRDIRESMKDAQVQAAAYTAKVAENAS